MVPCIVHIFVLYSDNICIAQDGETGLSWLPLEFPPNVRVVVSAGIN